VDRSHPGFYRNRGADLAEKAITSPGLGVFCLLTLLYVVFSHLKKGLFISQDLQVEQYLYWLI